jgi:hypothetical protein
MTPTDHILQVGTLASRLLVVGVYLLLVTWLCLLWARKRRGS